MAVQSQSVAPEAGESYRQFVERAHIALMPSVTDPYQRNSIVWRAWDAAHGRDLDRRVAEAFPADQYRNVPAVCYFIEHETTGRDGKPVKYTVKELGDIVDEHNDRADTDNWTAITDGHTVDGIVPQNMQPKVIGYAGPYRLGMVGRDKPRFAVFADEHHVLSEKPLLDRKRRRSVEINRFRDGRRPYIDPVAALGSESPRLPLPVARYAEDGADKVWYAADPNADHYEFCAASGMNTFIPSDSGNNRTRSRYETPASQQGNSSMNVDPNQGDDLIPRLVQALMSTPQMQWVTEQMEQAGGQQQSQQPVGAGQQPSPSVGKPDETQHMGGMAPMANQQNRYSVINDEGADLKERFSALSDRLHEVETERDQFAEKYSALDSAFKQQVAEHGLLRQSLVQLEQRAVDADRINALRSLKDRYSHFFDDEEWAKQCETCLYSEGSSMNNDQFTAHVATVERYAKKHSPVTPMIPMGSNGNTDPTDFAAEAELSAAIVERCTNAIDAGRPMTYEQAREEVIKERAARN